MGCLHILTFFHWKLTIPLVEILDISQGPAVCWPFFEDCLKWRVLSTGAWRNILWGYLAFAVLTSVLFLKIRLISLAWWSLVFLNLFKSALLFQDFRLQLNPHYMTFWITFVFLFIPAKRRVLQYLVVFFYFFAGTLKFTPEWISGAALLDTKPLGVPTSLIPAACMYVMMLELIFIWGLLSRKNWIFWGVLVQIIIFHVTSWPLVSFFYPMVMYSILSIFLLSRYLADPARLAQTTSQEVSLRLLFRGKEANEVYAVLITFALFQCVPYFFPGTASISGEGRLFALHVYDARVECKASVIVHTTSGQSHNFKLTAPYMVPRIACDPAVYFSLGKDLCRRLPQKAGYKSFDLHMSTRRWGEQKFRAMIDQHDFCRANLHYDLWRHNAWIIRDPNYTESATAKH